MTCNLEEMAERLRISVPTLRALIKRYPDLPVIERGAKGVAWVFDPAAVIAWYQAKRAAVAAGQAARDDQLAQISLPLDDATGADDRGITSDEHLKRLKIMKAGDELARDRKFLVLTADMWRFFNEAFPAFVRALEAYPREVGRAHNLPAPVIRDMERRLEVMQARAVEAARQTLAPHLPREGEDQADAAA